MGKFRVKLRVKELKPVGLKGWLKRHPVGITPPSGMAGLTGREDWWRYAEDEAQKRRMHELEKRPSLRNEDVWS